jgi:hypothetical protein
MTDTLVSLPLGGVALRDLIRVSCAAFERVAADLGCDAGLRIEPLALNAYQ